MFGRVLLGAAHAYPSAAASAVPADTRPWYPQKCVAIDRCAAVESVVWVVPAGGDGPQPVVSSAYGKAVVPKNFPVRESGDGRIHVCMRYDAFGSLEVTCLLVPPRLF